LIEPEGDGCGEVDGAEEDVSASVVSFGDAWEVLEAAEEALDQVSLAPGAVVE
jgi:hypothetical protein